MKIAVCEDNLADAQHLISLIGGSHVHTLFPSAEALLLELEEKDARFDLYLLDIFMEKMNGIELGKQINRLDDSALLCFISSSKDYYAEAFSIYAFQYLTKPVDREEFQKLLRKASERILRDREQSVSLSWHGRSVVIPYGRILYICSMGHTLYIYCKNHVVEKHVGRLDTFEAQLGSSVFVRCHQSYLVNLYNVTSLEKNNFICGDDCVPISRKYSAVKELYRALLFEDMD